MSANPKTAAPAWWRQWRTARWGDWVGLAARLIVGIVFIVAGALKVGNLQANVMIVGSYDLLPGWAETFVGYAQPPLEILLGAALVIGLFTRWMGGLGVIAMAVFIVGIASVWARGLKIGCGCFGEGGTNYPLDILRDIGLAILGVWLWVRPQSAWSVDGWIRGTPVPDDFDSDELDQDA